MSQANHTQEWLALFPALNNLEQDERDLLMGSVFFKSLKQGDVAYQPGWDCNDYLMCLQGQTRVYKSSESGREILLYRVGKGESCVLTTSCLMAGSGFPAESIAEQDTLLAAIPEKPFNQLMAKSAQFRKFVHDNYSDLLSELILLVNEVAFSRIDMRLASYLLKLVDDNDVVNTTHQQLAQDMGSVREVISRHINEWERRGWIRSQRGKIELLDKDKIAAYSQNRH